MESFRNKRITACSGNQPDVGLLCKAATSRRKRHENEHWSFAAVTPYSVSGDISVWTVCTNQIKEHLQPKIQSDRTPYRARSNE